jgi:copper(I)-binding protein
MHRSVHRGDHVHMSHVDRVTLNPHEELVFEPGGMHLMLMLSAEKLRAGQHIDIEFSCDAGSALTVNFAVVKMQ